jgi:hypothetical protein
VSARPRPARRRAAGQAATRPAELWKQEPEDHDFPAAEDFLTLVLPPDVAHATVQRLRKEGLIHRKAKDIIRASRLDVLAPTNAHVRADLAKVRAGKSLSPVLLVRGDARAGAPLLIADGYHRVCASFHLDENAEIPCRLVDVARVRP